MKGIILFLLVILAFTAIFIFLDRDGGLGEGGNYAYLLPVAFIFSWGVRSWWLKRKKKRF